MDGERVAQPVEEPVDRAGRDGEAHGGARAGTVPLGCGGRKKNVSRGGQEGHPRPRPRPAAMFPFMLRVLAGLGAAISFAATYPALADHLPGAYGRLMEAEAVRALLLISAVSSATGGEPRSTVLVLLVALAVRRELARAGDEGEGAAQKIFDLPPRKPPPAEEDEQAERADGARCDAAE